MESEASAGTSHVATSATTISSHELDQFSITVTSNFFYKYQQISYCVYIIS